MGEIQISAIYAALVNLVGQAESVSWARFNNFLVFNSILLLAWATLVAGQDFPVRNIVLKLICFVGMGGGILWSVLGYRGRSFHNLYVLKAKDFEEKFVKGGIAGDVLPFIATQEHRDKLGLSNVASSFALLICLPFFGAVLYAFLAWIR